jgi:pimeloyl-ACP methyl ester carboxylesterase
LHGLGATGDVWQGWRPLLDRRWPGRWLAPDLPGHGGSPPLSSYTFESLAAAVADTVGTDARTVVLGHSLGGVVGLALAGGGFPVPVQAVIGLGIKVAWAEDERMVGVTSGPHWKRTPYSPCLAQAGTLEPFDVKLCDSPTELRNRYRR